MTRQCEFNKDNMQCILTKEFSFYAISSDTGNEDMSLCYICDKHKQELVQEYEGKGYIVGSRELPCMSDDDD